MHQPVSLTDCENFTDRSFSTPRNTVIHTLPFCVCSERVVHSSHVAKPDSELRKHQAFQSMKQTCVQKADCVSVRFKEKFVYRQRKAVCDTDEMTIFAQKAVCFKDTQGNLVFQDQ